VRLLSIDGVKVLEAKRILRPLQHILKTSA
jgi:hypothetical protein